jgi:membrane protease YdiL (CAAX protease family)
LLPPRASIGWYGLALLSVPILATGLALAFSGIPSVTPSALLGTIAGGLVLQTTVGFLSTQLWEETAWTGFVQPRLQARYGAMLAAVITAALFTLQHVPLFVANASGVIIVALFFVVCVPFRALQGWIYNRTGNLFLVGLLHATGDAMAAGSIAGIGFLPRLYADNGDATLYQLGATALIGIIVIVATRARLGLSRS